MGGEVEADVIKKASSGVTYGEGIGVGQANVPGCRANVGRNG